MEPMQAGSKYKATAHLPLRDITGLMRADIKELIPGVKVSIRAKAGGMFLSIKSLPPGIDVWDPEYITATETFTRYIQRTDNSYTPEVRGYLNILREIHQAYNRQGPDPEIDIYNCKYDGTVGVHLDLVQASRDAILREHGIDPDDAAEIRTERQFAQLREAIGEALEAKKNWSNAHRQGKTRIDLALEPEDAATVEEARKIMRSPNPKSLLLDLCKYVIRINKESIKEIKDLVSRMDVVHEKINKR